MSSELTSLVTPTSLDELVDVLRVSETDAATVAIRGGGTKAGWGGPAQPAAVEIDVTGLAGVVEYAAGDLVVTVYAGTRLSDLQVGLATHKQWLALDPPESSATVGGILATAASGPHRLRYGAPRDQLIGLTVVLADGTTAKSGGKVVKNVAGYDLGKLFTGSYGTLGVIATATFKLQPKPAARRVVRVAAAEPGAAGRAIAAASAAPAAAEWDGKYLHVLLAGGAAAVDVVAADLARRLGTTDVTETVPPSFGARPWSPGEAALKVTHRLSALDPVISAVRSLLPGARVSAQVGSGVVWAGWPVGDAGVAAGVITELRRVVSSYDGTVVVVDAPAEVKAAVDVWGPVAGLSVMHRIKDQFDPGHRLNRGRFVDGI